MNKVELGRLEFLDPRAVWPLEGSDFTPWLADNLGILGEALGLDLELVEREAAVGDFSADLYARDRKQDRVVIIENQFDDTDHDHLGKLLTYASGLHASVVVWVAPRFREEHRQAIDWLNDHTDDTLDFFLVQLNIIKIDSSRPAVYLRLVSFPNQWSKSERGPSTPRMRSYDLFFEALADDLQKNHGISGGQKFRGQYYHRFPSGIPGATYYVTFAKGGNFGVQLYLDSSNHHDVFDALNAKKDIVEQGLGEMLTWERLDSKQYSQIGLYRKGAIDDVSTTLQELRAWAIRRLLKFREVFGPILHEMIEGVS